MEQFVEQHNIPPLNSSEIIARMPTNLQQAIPPNLVTKPSLILAQRLQSMGCQDEARMIMQLLVAAEPCHVEALYQLALDFNRKGEPEEAKKYMQRHHEQKMRENGMNPDINKDTLQFLLSTEGFAEPPERVPRAYVENLFDRFSNHFDECLLNRLAYNTPQILFDVFCEAAGGENAFKNCKKLVDLGCGTGLAGKCFQSISESLIGVDISSEMIEKSRITGVYNTLLVSEIEAFLKSDTLPIDVFVATDVFIYFGEVSPILLACRKRQNTGGLLAFSVEALPSSHDNEKLGYRLASTGRYQHKEPNISSSAQQAGYRVRSCVESVLRRENGYDVNGYMFVLIAI